MTNMQGEKRRKRYNEYSEKIVLVQDACMVPVTVGLCQIFRNNFLNNRQSFSNLNNGTVKTV